MRRFAGNPACGTDLALIGPIHARIGPFVYLNAGFGQTDDRLENGAEGELGDDPLDLGLEKAAYRLAG